MLVDWMKARIEYLVANTVVSEELKGRRVTVTMSRRGSMVTIYGKNGRRKRGILLRKLERMDILY